MKEEVTVLKSMQAFDVEVDCEFWIEEYGIEDYNTYETYYDWDNNYHIIKPKLCDSEQICSALSNFSR